MPAPLMIVPFANEIDLDHRYPNLSDTTDLRGCTLGASASTAD